MIVVVTPAATLPISVADVMAQLKIESEAETPNVNRALRAAVAYVESKAGLVLAPTTLQLRLDSWLMPAWHVHGRGIRVPRGPVRDVTQIEYVDEAEQVQALDTASWTWARTDAGADILFAAGFSFPALARDLAAVRVTFAAGFDDPAASGSGDDPALRLPDQVPMVLTMLVGHWLEHREAVSLEATHPVALAADALLAQVRIYR